MSSTGLNLAFELPAHRELPADRRDAIRRLLEDTVASGKLRPRPTRVRRALWPAVGLATASAVAAAVLVVADLGTSGGDVVHAATPPVLAAELGIGQPAAPELEALAGVAAQPPLTIAAPDGPPTVSTESWLLSVTVDAAPPEGAVPGEGAAAGLVGGPEVVTSAVIPVLRERTFQPDGSVHLREVHGEPQFPTAEWSDADRPGTAGSVLVDETFPAGELPSAYPDPLVNDPVALREQLLTVWPQAQDPAAALFQALHEVASERVMSTELQAAALTVLAREPGVVSLGEATDRRGRPAVAFGTDSADSGLDRRYVLLVDPGTGRMLGYEEVLTGETGELDVEAPAVTAYTVFL